MKQVTSERHNRQPWNRMMKIHEKIKAGGFPNCVQIAAALEVNLRTIKRDVHYMHEFLKVPLEYDRQRHGYYYTRPVEHLPSIPVTEAELFALLVAHKAITQYHGTPFQRPLEMAFKKLNGQLDRTERYTLDHLGEALSFRPFAPDDTDHRLFQVVNRAILEKRELRFKYRNLGQQQNQTRKVRPYHVACIENHWYLFAFDVDRDAIRTFSLSRLGEPELLTAHFTKPKDFKTDDYLRGSLNVFKGHDDFEDVIEFDAWATDLIHGRHWHASQELTELPGGCSRLRMRLNSIEEVERWVLSWGTHATVIRPDALRARLESTGRQLAQRYATGPEPAAPTPPTNFFRPVPIFVTPPVVKRHRL